MASLRETVDAPGSPARRLGTILLWDWGGMMLVALLAAAALIGLVGVVHQQAMSIMQADARIRASLRAKVALLSFARASDEAASLRDPASEAAAQQAEQNLRSAVAQVIALSDMGRKTQIDHFASKSANYIAYRDLLQTEGLPVGEIIRRATPDLHATFIDLDTVISADDGWIQQLRASSRRWDEVARGFGVAAVALLVAGFLITLRRLRRLVFRPLLALSSSMTRFARGEREARAEAQGALELRTVAHTFNAMAHRITAQDQERLVFLAGVVHDLRNPVAALKMAVRPVPPAAEMNPAMFPLAQRQLERLERMLTDLLDAARIQVGELTLQPRRVDLRSVAGNVAELYSGVSPRHPIELVAPANPIWVDCDDGRIEQVLGNLVSNAVKYSPEGGPVTLTVGAERSFGVVTIADRGMGITPEDQAQIFEPFRRGTVDGTGIPGAGLGLSIVKRIVEAHRGTIELQSAIGLGTTVTVRLPLSDTTDRLRPDTMVMANDGSSRRHGAHLGRTPTD